MTAARFNAANGSELIETARNLLDSHLTELDDLAMTPPVMCWAIWKVKPPLLLLPPCVVPAQAIRPPASNADLPGLLGQVSASSSSAPAAGSSAHGQYCFRTGG
jgi:hypothetical protein